MTNNNFNSLILTIEFLTSAIESFINLYIATMNPLKNDQTFELKIKQIKTKLTLAKTKIKEMEAENETT